MKFGATSIRPRGNPLAGRGSALFPRSRSSGARQSLIADAPGIPAHQLGYR
jgi:hypothetical protein